MFFSLLFFYYRWTPWSICCKRWRPWIAKGLQFYDIKTSWKYAYYVGAMDFIKCAFHFTQSVIILFAYFILFNEHYECLCMSILPYSIMQICNGTNSILNLCFQNQHYYRPPLFGTSDVIFVSPWYHRRSFRLPQACYYGFFFFFFFWGGGYSRFFMCFPKILHGSKIMCSLGIFQNYLRLWEVYPCSL